MTFEDAVESGQGQQLDDPVRRPDELQSATLPRHGDVGCDELAQPGAVDVTDAAQVQEHVAGAALNRAQFVGNDHLDGLFEATVQATEEAIVNAMVAARDMRGEGGRHASALPHAELVKLLKRYGRYRGSK